LIHKDNLELAIKSIFKLTSAFDNFPNQAAVITLFMKDPNFKDLLLKTNDISLITAYILDKLGGGFNRMLIT